MVKKSVHRDFVAWRFSECDYVCALYINTFSNKIFHFIHIHFFLDKKLDFSVINRFENRLCPLMISENAKIEKTFEKLIEFGESRLLNEVIRISILHCRVEYFFFLSLNLRIQFVYDGFNCVLIRLIYTIHSPFCLYICVYSVALV